MEFTRQLLPQSVLFWAITSLWLFEAWPRRRRGARLSTRGSLELALIALCMVAAIVVCGQARSLAWDPLVGRADAQLLWLGLGFYGAGVALRRWARATLGPWFSFDVEVDTDQQLVSTGPYRWLCHPLYTGLLLATLGLCLLQRTPLFALVGTAVVGLALAWRIRREERALDQRLDGRYRRWSQGRARLLPLVY